MWLFRVWSFPTLLRALSQACNRFGDLVRDFGPLIGKYAFFCISQLGLSS